jgi:hypothetical protein
VNEKRKRAAPRTSQHYRDRMCDVLSPEERFAQGVTFVTSQFVVTQPSLLGYAALSLHCLFDGGAR